MFQSALLSKTGLSTDKEYVSEKWINGRGRKQMEMVKETLNNFQMLFLKMILFKEQKKNLKNYFFTNLFPIPSTM